MRILSGAGRLQRTLGISAYLAELTLCNDPWFLVAGKLLFQWLRLIQFILVAFPDKKKKKTEIDTKSGLVRGLKLELPM
jgi:hypothetical protein